MYCEICIITMYFIFIINKHIALPLLHSIHMDNYKTGNIYLFCRIVLKESHFWLKEVNDVLSLEEAYNNIPGFSEICYK